ncbi:DUF4397 domain-containing protein [Leifsonia lichenia]
MHARTSRNSVLSIGVSVAIATMVTLAGPAPANAADSTTGWVRVGHFSADTTGVDVQITALAGGATTYALKDVTYGQVSKYLDMAQGTYVISMRSAGASASSSPIVKQSVTVQAGTASTVAAYGANADLKTTVFRDDLTAPADGQARIRLIQASTKHSTVTVKTSTGLPIAANAKTGSATGYASVPAGPWTLDASGSGAKAAAALTLTNGSVNTLLVLDNATGGVTLTGVVDSSSVGSQPKGGVQTGGGWLATHDAGTGPRQDAGARGQWTAF